MKKLVVIAVAGMFIFSTADVKAFGLKSTVTLINVAPEEWMKSETGAWMGKHKVWYKLDKEAKLWWSKDGKKWDAVKDGMWQDKDGKWLKIGDGKLWWSTDGKEWAEVPEWKWQGTDGKWYKFDQSWNLWVNKG